MTNEHVPDVCIWHEAEAQIACLSRIRPVRSESRRYFAGFRGGARLSLLYERRMIMLNPGSICDQTARPIPWDKGKLIGAKPPLLLKHVWSIRSKLRVDGQIRDLAMFNLAIDSKLRGCDVVSVKVEDIAPHGVAVARASVRQRKTGRTVKFELTEQTREALDEYLRAFGRKTGDFLFPSRRHKRVSRVRSRLRVGSKRSCGNSVVR
jgi:integrase